MSEDVSQIINLIIAIAGLSGVGGLFWGIYEYRENQITKRKEVLFQLVHEFDRSEDMAFAKKILDGYIYNFPESINLGINYFSKDNLRQILRYPTNSPEIHDSNEMKLRESFSALFDFFDKLGYLYSNGAVKHRELRYFAYYINKARENDGVLQFLKDYEFRWNEELPQLK